MLLSNFECKLFTIVLIVHSLRNQLLPDLIEHSFNSLQVCDRHIEEVLNII